MSAVSAVHPGTLVDWQIHGVDKSQVIPMGRLAMH